MPIVVIGMHRSGTSMVSRLANLAGLFIGEEDDLLPATEHNEAGHWEPGWICDIDDEALAECGGTWHSPPIGRDCDVRLPEWVRLREKAKSSVRTYFDGHGAWGWKDPRTTLLLPFWRSIVPDLRFIVCVRNPLDVAGSLARRDGIRLAHALALWQYYTETALRETRPDERILIHYEGFFHDRDIALSRFFSFLGISEPKADSEQSEAIRGFIDSNLRHHCHTLRDVLDHEEVPDYTKQFYESLWEAGGTDAATVELSDAPKWRALTATLDSEGRRHVCLENCRLRWESWDRRRLNSILDSPALAIAVASSRLLRGKPALYRLACRYAPASVRNPSKSAKD